MHKIQISSVGDTGLEDPEKEHTLPYSLPVVEEWSDPSDKVNYFSSLWLPRPYIAPKCCPGPALHVLSLSMCCVDVCFLALCSPGLLLAKVSIHFSDGFYERPISQSSDLCARQHLSILYYA